MKVLFLALIVIGFAAFSWGVTSISSGYRHLEYVNAFQDGLLDAYRSGASAEQIAEMEEDFREYRQIQVQRKPYYVQIFALMFGLLLASWAITKLKSLTKVTTQGSTDDLP